MPKIATENETDRGKGSLKRKAIVSGNSSFSEDAILFFEFDCVVRGKLSPPPEAKICSLFVGIIVHNQQSKQRVFQEMSLMDNRTDNDGVADTLRMFSHIGLNE